MGSESHPQIRGFDSYEVRLGDELRGERASVGKSLLDVQRDLRIRAEYIDAIENADASAFPFSGFAAGYVRTYARYLSLDPDDVYRRFCEESGFQGAASNGSIEICANRTGSEGQANGSNKAGRRIIDEDPVFSSRFIAAHAREPRVDIMAGVRGFASIAVLAALVVGLGYGGWNILLNLQRVGFAPLPSAPEVQIAAPDIFTPTQTASVGGDVVDVDAGQGRGLASIYAFQEVESPVVEPRDGPIASIDPSRAGVFAAPPVAEAPVVADADAGAPPDEERRHMAEFVADDPSLFVQREAQPVAAAVGVDILATEDAWVRIRDGSDKVLFSGILGPGERFALPEEAIAPSLRAGNAGSVYVIVGGLVFGPLGSGPEVAKNVALTPDAIRAAYPAATAFETSELEADSANVDARGATSTAALTEE